MVGKWKQKCKAAAALGMKASGLRGWLFTPTAHRRLPTCKYTPGRCRLSCRVGPVLSPGVRVIQEPPGTYSVALRLCYKYVLQ